jgi:ankyrin repeat protein
MSLYELSRDGNLRAIKRMTIVPGDTLNSALRQAVIYGHIHIVKYLVQKGADVNYALDMNSVSDLAMMNGYVDILKFLIKKGAVVDVNEANDDEVYPLYYSAQYGNLDMVNFLLSKGANVHELTQGRNALMAARNTEIIAALLVGGADINAKDIDGDTALMIASNEGNTNMVDFLLKNNAKLDLLNNDKRTALMLAVLRGYLETVTVLLRGGARVDLQDSYDETALIIASRRYDPDVVVALKRHIQNIRSRLLEIFPSFVVDELYTLDVE